jgi:hypothetical protein
VGGAALRQLMVPCLGAPVGSCQPVHLRGAGKVAEIRGTLDESREYHLPKLAHTRMG